jgi:hypothetical protein
VGSGATDAAAGCRRDALRPRVHRLRRLGFERRVAYAFEQATKKRIAPPLFP